MRADKATYAKKQREIRDVEIAALGGSAIAQDRLGAILATAYFVEKDEKGALYWYFQAVKQGNTYSKYNAGTMLILGEGGLPANETIGMQLIEEAANSGYSDACSYLSMCYWIGRNGRALDRTLSERWTVQAQAPNEPEYFSVPRDIANELGIVLPKPTIRFKNPPE